MKRIVKNFIILIALVTLIEGCGLITSYKYWKSEAIRKSVDNEYFSAKIFTVACDRRGCDAFLLSVKNKTDKALELNWNKTLYIVHGQTSGGFMFEGILYQDRNSPKSPDIIFPNGEFNKRVWPNNLVELSSVTYGWNNNPMPSGENGVYLTVNVDGKEINEKLTVSLSKIKPQAKY